MKITKYGILTKSMNYGITCGIGGVYHNGNGTRNLYINIIWKVGDGISGTNSADTILEAYKLINK
jgi:hypothetical protein